jgi:YbbR domain-containing protein
VLRGKQVELIRKYILNDFKLKALSVVLAVILWFAISYMGESKLSVSVKVMPANLSKELIVKRVDGEEILVTISGPVSLLKKIRSRDVRASVDLSNAKEGRNTVSLDRDNVQVPQGIKVEHIEPDFLTVDTDRIMEKRLRVIVKLDAKWSNIYKVKSWYPAYVNVEGSRGSLDTRSTIETVPVENDFGKEEEETYVGLDTKDMLVSRVRPDTIRVIIRRD